MKIALLGYGKMGKTIETMSKERGHTIVYKTSKAIDVSQLQLADIAIDFSIPSAAYNNITSCFIHGIPVVSGTTGWLEDYTSAVDLCKTHSGAFIYASNFSIGVNLFFKLNTVLAQLMSKQNTYSISLTETHHTQKRDAPSGTAITLAKDIIANTALEDWQLKDTYTSKTETHQLPIIANRKEHVPGTHTVTYQSKIDSIDITHTAHNRDGFALGAIIAAEWLIGKTGIFTMTDVLNSIT